MNRKKILRRSFIALLGVIFALNASIACAEVYIGEGSYVMSKVETLEVARERAKADAMRNAAEKAGVYVKSYSRTKNFVLEEDVIETMTANILKLIDKPIFQMLEEVDNLEGVMIRCTVKAQINDSDINSWLNKDDNEKSMLVAQNEALRKANEEHERQIAELKRQLADNPQDTEKITQEFVVADKIFLSNQKIEEARKLWKQKDFNGAKNLLDEAVKLNPDNAEAYFGRGTTYLDLKQYARAIKDFDKNIELEPNKADSYINRGFAYSHLGQKERAIQDFNKAIELKPNDDYAYNNRGIAYLDLKQYKRAIQDFNKAIELEPNKSYSYTSRGFAYSHLGQKEQAIQDFNKAIKLNPNNDLAYNNRGIAYALLRNFKQAIADSTKAIQINPNYANAYFVRGFCYQQLDETAKAQADFKKAKELGYKG